MDHHQMDRNPGIDRRTRIWVKALFWQILGFGTSALVGYGFTGSYRIGGAMALANAAIGLIFYVAYERVWERVCRGRKTRDRAVKHVV